MNVHQLFSSRTFPASTFNRCLMKRRTYGLFCLDSMLWKYQTRHPSRNQSVYLWFGTTSRGFGNLTCAMAICMHCNQKLSGSSNSGTTHLRNHLMRCLKRSNYNASQILSAKRRKKDNAITLTTIVYDDGQRKEDCLRQTTIKYDHERKREGIVHVGSSKFGLDRSRLDLARMIILHGYPLAMVDHDGLRFF